MHIMHNPHVMLSLRIGGLPRRANRTALGTQRCLVLPRSPSYEPDPPAQHIRREYSDHRDELQEEATGL